MTTFRARLEGGALLSVSVCAIALGASGCASNRGSGGNDAGRGGGAGSANGGSANGGSGGGGIHVPGVPVTGDSDSVGAGLSIEGSTLAPDPSGQIRWLFTLENHGEAPACRRQFTAKIYDSAGQLLAGSEPSSIYLEGVPAFNGEMVAGLFRGSAGQLMNCIGVGGRGVGNGTVWDRVSVTLPADEVSRLLAATARIEYTLSPDGDTSDVTPDADLLRLQDLRLVEASGGKVVQGSAITDTELRNWRVDVVLYDERGRIVDLVSASGTAVVPGTPIEFETSAGDASATRLEAFPGATLEPTQR